MSGLPSISVTRGLRWLAVGIGLGCALLVLELTEGSRTTVLRPGTADTLVDATLGSLAVTTIVVGAVVVLVARPRLPTSNDAIREPVAAFWRAAQVRIRASRSEVRLRGLVDLELLGQASARDRRAVVACWCRYLRGPATDGVEVDPGSTTEAEVRRTLQQMIARHLRRDDDRDAFATYWPEVRELDLEGAQLVDLDLRRCAVPGANFQRAVFHGVTSFERAEFDLEPSFDTARFLGDTSFREVSFHRGAAFYLADFRAHVSFDAASFHREANFYSAHFAEGARFRGVMFGGGIHFLDATVVGALDAAGARSRRRTGHHLPDRWAIAGDPASWAHLVRAD